MISGFNHLTIELVTDSPIGTFILNDYASILDSIVDNGKPIFANIKINMFGDANFLISSIMTFALIDNVGAAAYNSRAILYDGNEVVNCDILIIRNSDELWTLTISAIE